MSSVCPALRGRAQALVTTPPLWRIFLHWTASSTADLQRSRPSGEAVAGTPPLSPGAAYLLRLSAITSSSPATTFSRNSDGSRANRTALSSSGKWWRRASRSYRTHRITEPNTTCGPSGVASAGGDAVL